MKRIAILGSTGSIGTQTLEVVQTNGDIEVVSLAAGSNIELLEEQVLKFHPKVVCVYREEKAKELRERLKDETVRVVAGMDGLIEAACIPEAEIVGDSGGRNDWYPSDHCRHRGWERYCPGK